MTTTHSEKNILERLEAIELSIDLLEETVSLTLESAINAKWEEKILHLTPQELVTEQERILASRRLKEKMEEHVITGFAGML